MHTSDIDTYAIELAAARLAALRALAEILNTTDAAEKRRAATAILRLPDPQQPLASAKGASRPLNTHAVSPPHEPAAPGSSLDPTPNVTLEEALARAHQFLAEYAPDDPALHADLPDLPDLGDLPDLPAARLAAAAGRIHSG